MRYREATAFTNCRRSIAPSRCWICSPPVRRRWAWPKLPLPSSCTRAPRIVSSWCWSATASWSARPRVSFASACGLCDFGSRAIEQYDLRDRAQLHLKTLVAEVEETAHLCILEKTHMVYIDKQEPERTIRMISRVGASSPIHCTAVGKAILATMSRPRVEEMLQAVQLERFTRRTMTSREALLKELDRTSRRGYAVDDEEREEGVRCAGMAILDGRGEAIAAVSISGPSFRVTMQKIPAIAGKLMTCVKGIQHDLGFIPFAR